MRRIATLTAVAIVVAVFLSLYADSQDPASETGSGPLAVFSIRRYGASGVKTDNARPAIQKAVDACAAAGGGMVYVPPGEYATGTIRLRSHVRFFIEAGATIFSMKDDKAAFDKDALFYGEDLDGITLEGRGTIDGRGEYEWRPKGDFHDDFIYPNQLMQERAGKPLFRSFPKSNQYGKLVLLLRCRDVRIAGLSFVDSPSWTIHPYGCERMVIDGVTIKSSQRDGVWAAGIDPDGCKDLRISNSTIETGDDALVFYSMNWFGPALPCENITVTNCRLSSSSSALKFCDGNMNAIRRVTVDNCVITNSNRGIAVMDFDGGEVSDVILSNLTIECNRFDWFWWGDGDPFHFNVKKRSEIHKNWKKEDDRPAGAVRNLTIRNVIARGKGSSVCNGHPENWLEGVTLDNVKLIVAHDPSAAYDKAINALSFRWARNLKLKDVEIVWEKPAYAQWQSALVLEDIEGVDLDGFKGGPAPGGSALHPAVILDNVEKALVRNCRSVPGTGTFMLVRGERSRDIGLAGNDFRDAKVPFELGPGASKSVVRNLKERP
ncbi:MAG: glycosyl hydrolase family 28 protein [Candidatus Aminicenantes bacterium]|nr:glycosyl hydrolase family 28 protein [Candidatus Aminicenantes bacterium]